MGSETEKFTELVEINAKKMTTMGNVQAQVGTLASTHFCASDFSVAEIGCLGLASIIQMLAVCPHTPKSPVMAE